MDAKVFITLGDDKFSIVSIYIVFIKSYFNSIIIKPLKSVVKDFLCGGERVDSQSFYMYLYQRRPFIHSLHTSSPYKSYPIFPSRSSYILAPDIKTTPASRA